MENSTKGKGSHLTAMKLVAICGSTRDQSANLSLIKAIGRLFANELQVAVFQGLAAIPHFNPDLDNEMPPAAVSAFRRQLKEAEGILICTPEYAMGVPGTLKNAIDWTVSSMEFSHKPVALITASSAGRKAHHSLLETLTVIEADIPENSRLLVSFVKTKVKDDTIVEETTLAQVRVLVKSLMECIEKKRAGDL